MSSPSPSELLADASGCTLLGVSGGAPSAESADYVSGKQQFQLHGLLTEQRHPNTTNMSQTIGKDATAGLLQILSVDDDITAKLAAISSDAAALAGVAELQAAFLRCLRQKRKVYVYGCGATGRLAKLMESTFWRPFWRRLSTSPSLASVWAQVVGHVSPSIVSDLIGEMTGGDRALISSLEGFEDLQLIGALQLADRGVQRGDVVLAVTEGGETSSVIGTVRAALQQWREGGEGGAGGSSDDAETRKHLFFVYNNPDALLLPFDRSASVLKENGISKINLSTGPQAITGSTRMQATSSETFVIAAALHCALDQFLRGDCGLSSEQMGLVGFAPDAPASLQSKLNEYGPMLASVKSSAAALARLTEWESACYAGGHFSTYFALRGLMTVFIDNTERSPTFRLFALDTVEMDARKCWLQVWTAARTAGEAWEAFLGRPFRGLAQGHYEAPFRAQVTDPYLLATALRSLPQAGDEQGRLYDFSFSEENQARRGGVQGGDLGVLVLVGEEEAAALADVASDVSRYVRLFVGENAPKAGPDGLPTRVAILLATDAPAAESTAKIEALLREQGLPSDRVLVCVFSNSARDDPLMLRPQTALKVALNAHSTGVMARLGKVLGNCMVNVSPSNLKLIGRATALIQAHVNPAAEKAGLPRVSYALTNAVLYDSIEAIRAEQAKAGTAPGSQSAEVALCIVRILSSLAAGKAMPAEEALELLRQKGLGPFLEEFEAKHAKKE